MKCVMGRDVLKVGERRSRDVPRVSEMVLNGFLQTDSSQSRCNGTLGREVSLTVGLGSGGAGDSMME